MNKDIMPILYNAAQVFFMVLLSVTVIAFLYKKKLFKMSEEITQKMRLSRISIYCINGFLALYIPLSVFMILFSIIDTFAFSQFSFNFFSAAVQVIFAFILERFIEKNDLKNIAPGSVEPAVTNTAVFAYIELYSDIECIYRDILRQIAASQSALLGQFEQTQNKSNHLLEHINGYIQWQTGECQKLLEEKNTMENFFSVLAAKTEQMGIELSKYTKKLNNSCIAILYCEKEGNLVKDIDESFVARYSQTSGEVIKHIELIEQQLRKIVDRYSYFKEHLGPYSQKIGVYGSRMESAMQSLNKTSEVKQEILKITGKKIEKSIVNINETIARAMEDAGNYLHKNTFVLSKILETYQANVIPPKRIKKIIQAWQNISSAGNI